MSVELDSSGWIFVNYAPGSFGSFLTKIIESSPSVAGIKTTEVFNEYNASHLNYSRWISNFHDGDDIERWIDQSWDQQQQYLIANTNAHPGSLRQVHRLTVPKYNSKFRQHFPLAKFIKITVEPEQLELVAVNMAQKTFNNWLIKLNDPLKTILGKVADLQQREYYLKECRQRIINIIDNTEEPSTFNVPVTVFFDPDQFNSTIKQLTEWLGIEAVETGSLYKEFLTRHKEFITT